VGRVLFTSKVHSQRRRDSIMYFTGIDEPDNEPRRNKYAAKDRKSKFTEKVAETVVDGDLYFSQRSAGHQRFYVPVENGEHGLEEGGLLCVTHIFKKPFPDLDGRWSTYDGGGNLVIKIDRPINGDLGYEALHSIEQALYKTPLGRAVGRDTLRGMAESLSKTFGIDVDGDAQPTWTVDRDAEKLAVALPAPRKPAASGKFPFPRLAWVWLRTSSINSLISVRINSPMKRDSSSSPCRSKTPRT